MFEKTTILMRETYPVSQAIDRAKNLCSDEGWDLCDETDETLRALHGLGSPLPLSLLPIGFRGEQVMAMDTSSAAIERNLAPLYVSTQTPYWELKSIVTAEGNTSKEDAPYISFQHASQAAKEAAQKETQKAEAPLLNRALHSPFFSARNQEDIAWVQHRALSLEDQQGFDAFGLRLADAGIDGQAWRVIGAERAIANRVRFAIHAFHCAHFFGISTEVLAPALTHIHGRASWPWANHLLTLHKAVYGEDG
jgi:hypothetical protein